mgnify:CR=1 FL=1
MLRDALLDVGGRLEGGLLTATDLDGIPATVAPSEATTLSAPDGATRRVFTMPGTDVSLGDGAVQVVAATDIPCRAVAPDDTARFLQLAVAEPVAILDEKRVARAVAEAEDRRRQLGWNIVADSGRGFRRIVPSPRPREIIELPAIEALLAAGHIPIACGGGGVPVVRDARGLLHGVAAVIDKDRAAALLASQLGASLLLLCTGVPSVFLNFGKASAQPLRRIDAATAARHLAEGQFPPGSMGPKMEAALDFLASGGKEVLITSPEALAEARAGREGTRIVRAL